MDYTIIGAEANLAARLQSIAEPGQIVLSYETFALARDVIDAHALAPITMKGIAREVVPYVVQALADGAGSKAEVFSTHVTGADFYLDPRAVDSSSAERLRAVLQAALRAIDQRWPA
jgi:hypothetical protein